MAHQTWGDKRDITTIRRQGWDKHTFMSSMKPRQNIASNVTACFHTVAKVRLP